MVWKRQLILLLKPGLTIREVITNYRYEDFKFAGNGWQGQLHIGQVAISSLSLQLCIQLCWSAFPLFDSNFRSFDYCVHAGSKSSLADCISATVRFAFVELSGEWCMFLLTATFVWASAWPIWRICALCTFLLANGLHCLRQDFIRMVQCTLCHLQEWSRSFWHGQLWWWEYHLPVCVIHRDANTRQPSTYLNIWK